MRRPTGRDHAPLLEWGDALRAAKSRRRKLARRAALIAVGGAILLGSVLFPPAPRLVWNASASAPIGLYAVAPGTFAEPRDMVIARVPERFRRLVATPHHLPMNLPAMKCAPWARKSSSTGTLLPSAALLTARAARCRFGAAARGCAGASSSC
jgi:hypothetical protein